MSFILDALKKSETDRQRQSSPALFEVKVAAPRRRFPLWAAGLAVLLGVNMLVLVWLLLRRPEPVAQAAPPAAAAATPMAANAAPPGMVTVPATVTLPTTVNIPINAAPSVSLGSGSPGSTPPQAATSIASSSSVSRGSSPVTRRPSAVTFPSMRRSARRSR